LKKALKILGIIVGILLAIVLGPWLIVAALWIGARMSRERGVEHLCLSTPISGASRPTGARSGASLQDAERS